MLLKCVGTKKNIGRVCNGNGHGEHKVHGSTWQFVGGSSQLRPVGIKGGDIVKCKPLIGSKKRGLRPQKSSLM